MARKAQICTMVLPVVAYGDPVLRKEAEDVEQNMEGLRELIDNMWETMYKAEGVGLAAPQIGQSLRLFVVDGSPFGEGTGDIGRCSDPTVPVTHGGAARQSHPPTRTSSSNSSSTAS